MTNPRKDAKSLKIPIFYQTLVSPLIFSTEESKMSDAKENIFQKLEFMFSQIQSNRNNSLIELVLIKTNYGVNSLGQGPVADLAGKLTDNREDVKKIIGCIINYFQNVILFSKNGQTRERIENLINYVSGLDIFSGNTAIIESRIFRGINNINLGSQKLQEEFLYVTNGLLDYLEILKNKKDISNLFLAALENSLVSKIGGVVLSSCKSGKDRNGLLLLSVDAIQVYFSIYGTIPPLTEDKKDTQERKDFDEIICLLFESGHQAIMASTNAQGCVGLKSVKDVLPKQNVDMLEKKGLLKASNNCASLNRPKNYNKNASSTPSKTKSSTKKETPKKPVKVFLEKIQQQKLPSHLNSLDDVRIDVNKLIIREGQRYFFFKERFENPLYNNISFYLPAGQSPINSRSTPSKFAASEKKARNQFENLPSASIPANARTSFWQPAQSPVKNNIVSQQHSDNLEKKLNSAEAFYKNFLSQLHNKVFDENHLAQVKELLNSNEIILHSTDDQGNNLWHHAVEGLVLHQGNFHYHEFIKLLFNHNADFNKENFLGTTPIELAGCYGVLSELEKIIDIIPSTSFKNE